jgi:cell shape-determining protein MreC
MKIRSNQFPTKVAVVAGFFVLLFLAGVFARGVMFSAVTWIAGPFWNVENALSSETVPGAEAGEERTRVELNRENARLRERVQELKAAEIERDVLRQQNARFSEILNRKGERELVVAEVLSKPPVSPYDTFLAGAGRSSGVESGANSFMYGDIAIGEVIEVSQNASKVKLYSSSGEKTQVLIGENNVKAQATGQGAGNFQVELPGGVEIKIGAKAYLPGEGGSVLGSIEHVEQKESETFQTVFIKSPVDIWTLRYLQIEI